MLTTGRWQHPLYGELAIDESRLRRFAANFEAGAYGQAIPLDVNHCTSPEGAPGWLTAVRVLEGDGRHLLQVKAELNSYGDKLITDNRVKYLSAEFWDEWVSPEGSKVRDLLTGVALTERPFFKHLGAIAAVEMAGGEAGETPAHPVNGTERETAGGEAGETPAHPVNGTERETAGRDAGAPRNGTAGESPTGVSGVPRREASPHTALIFFEETETMPKASNDNEMNAGAAPEQGMQLSELQAKLTALEQQNAELVKASEAAQRLALSERRERQLTELANRFAGLVFGGGHKLSPAKCAEAADFAIDMSEEPERGPDGKALLGADGKALPCAREAFVEFVRTFGEALVPQGVRGFAGDGDDNVAPAAAAGQSAELVKLNARVTELQKEEPGLRRVEALKRIAREDPRLMAAAQGLE